MTWTLKMLWKVPELLGSSSLNKEQQINTYLILCNSKAHSGSIA
jgi:hypothetical protein